jgi:uncharacterized membrane protein YfcA
MSVNLLVILGLGGGVGFLSGLFGVGGGFLLTPLLMWIGVSPAVAAATDANQIVAASTSGAYAHYKNGHVDLKMGIVLFAGSLLGGAIGVKLMKALLVSGNAEFWIKLSFVVLLGGIGLFMLVESLRALRRQSSVARGATTQRVTAFQALVARWPLPMTFEVSGVRTSLVTPLLLGSLVGLLAALMGVGGGFIMVPALVYLMGMRMIMVVGTGLFQVLLTTGYVTFLQALLNHNVDIVLAVLLLVGSSIGAQFGVRIGRRLKGAQLRLLLAVLVLLVMGKMLFDLLVQPADLIQFAGGHG